MAMSGTTQTVLAQRIGKDQAWMSRYLAGTHDADLATVERLAAAFGHTVATLLDVVTDEKDARVLEMYRSLSPTDRATIVRLLELTTRPKRTRRSSR
jgi:transcriptional regulator with XRE-family HTH domain